MKDMLVIIALYLVPIALAAWSLGYRKGRAGIDSVRLDKRSGALAASEITRVLEAEARRARRYARPLSLVLLDLRCDNADLEPRFVDALRRHVRECDSVGRLDAQRFVLVLVECPGAEASHVLKRCSEMLRQGFPKGLRFDAGAVSYGGLSPTSAVQLLGMAESHLAENRVAAVPSSEQPQLA